MLSYDPETGDLRWLVRPAKQSPARAGDLVTLLKMSKVPYPYLRYKGRLYLVHRIVWKWVTGEDLPDGLMVDHKDRDPYNNRWGNLRPATSAQNAQNSSRGENRNISKRGDRWIVRIQANGLKINQEGFESEAAAREAAKKLRALHHGEFATDNSESPEAVRKRFWLESGRPSGV